MLSGTYAEFTQNPAKKKNLLSSDNQILADSSPLDPVWGIGLRADDPRASNPCQCEALSAVREAVRDGETGSAHPASPSWFCTCTADARTKKSCPRRGRAVNSGQRSQSFPLGVSDLFLGRVGQLKAVKFRR